MHFPILPFLLLPLTLAFHTPRPSRPSRPSSPFPFRFNNTLPTNLTFPTNLPFPTGTGSPPRLPWSPNPSRGRSGRGRRPGGQIFPTNTTLSNTPPTFIPPVSLQTYRVSTGAISCSSDTGLVQKTPGSGAGDTTVLVSFVLPAQARGRMCQLFFYLPSALEGENGNGTTNGTMMGGGNGTTVGEGKVSGSAQIDIFTTSAPAPYTCPIASWPPGNQRDQHLGRMEVVSTPAAGGGRTWAGVWEERFSGFLTRPTECETFGAGRRGFEVVGVGEEVLVKWTGSGGLVVGYW